MPTDDRGFLNRLTMFYSLLSSLEAQTVGKGKKSFWEAFFSACSEEEAEMIRGDWTAVNVVVGICFQILLRLILCLLLHDEFSGLFKHRGIAEPGLARDEVTELFLATSTCTE